MKSSPFSLKSIAINLVQGDAAKRPVIFLHGNSQNSTCGEGIMAFFSKRGHTVLSYDLPGHGNSILDTEDYLFEDLIRLNFEIMNSNNIKNPILCGHSLGGMVHSGTIAKYKIPDANLILCGSLDSSPVYVANKYLPADEVQKYSNELIQYMNEGFKLFKKQHLYQYFENRQVEDEIINIINRRYSNPKASFINLSTLGNFNVRNILINMNVAVLVLHGKKEQVIHPALIKGLADEYKNIKISWYPENGHLAFYQQPEMTNQFLENHYEFIALN